MGIAAWAAAAVFVALIGVGLAQGLLRNAKLALAAAAAVVLLVGIPQVDEQLFTVAIALADVVVVAMLCKALVAADADTHAHDGHAADAF